MKKTVICVLLCLSLFIPVSLAAEDALYAALREKTDATAVLTNEHLTDPTAYNLLPDKLKSEWDRYRFVYLNDEQADSFTRNNAALTDEEFERVVFSPLYPVLACTAIMEEGTDTSAVQRFADTFSSATWGIYLVYLDDKPLAVMRGQLSSYNFSLTGIKDADAFDAAVGGRAPSDFLFVNIPPSTDMIASDGTVLAAISWDRPPVTTEQYVRAYELASEKARRNQEEGVVSSSMSGSPSSMGGSPMLEYLFGSARSELDKSFDVTAPSRNTPWVLLGVVSAVIILLAFMAVRFKRKNRA